MGINDNMLGEKIRILVIFFCVHIVLTLVQTPYGSLGTILGIVSSVLVLISLLFDKQFSLRRLKITKEGIIAFLFAIYLISRADFWSNASMIAKLIAEIGLFSLLSGVAINKKEESLIKNVYIISIVFYSLLAIRYCLSFAGYRYLHSNIVLFGATLNPNHVGLPMIGVTCLLLDNILQRKRLFFSFGMYSIVFIAIVLTASRGNFLSMVISNSAVVLTYVFTINTSQGRKIGGLILSTAIAVIIMYFVESRYSAQWDRMSVIDASVDNGRLDIWRSSIYGWFQAPILGNGLGMMLNNFGMVSHNTFLQLLYETGIVGFTLFMILISRVLIKSFQNENKIYFCVLLSLVIKVFFLSGLDNRFFWGLSCWIQMVNQSNIFSGIRRNHF